MHMPSVLFFFHFCEWIILWENYYDGLRPSFTLQINFKSYLPNTFHDLQCKINHALNCFNVTWNWSRVMSIIEAESDHFVNMCFVSVFIRRIFLHWKLFCICKFPSFISICLERKEFIFFIEMFENSFSILLKVLCLCQVSVSGWKFIYLINYIALILLKQMSELF